MLEGEPAYFMTREGVKLPMPGYPGSPWKGYNAEDTSCLAPRMKADRTSVTRSSGVKWDLDPRSPGFGTGWY